MASETSRLNASSSSRRGSEEYGGEGGSVVDAGLAYPFHSKTEASLDSPTSSTLTSSCDDSPIRSKADVFSAGRVRALSPMQSAQRRNVFNGSQRSQSHVDYLGKRSHNTVHLERKSQDVNRNSQKRRRVSAELLPPPFPPLPAASSPQSSSSCSSPSIHGWLPESPLSGPTSRASIQNQLYPHSTAHLGVQADPMAPSRPFDSYPFSSALPGGHNPYLAPPLMSGLKPSVSQLHPQPGSSSRERALFPLDLSQTRALGGAQSLYPQYSSSLVANVSPAVQAGNRMSSHLTHPLQAAGSRPGDQFRSVRGRDRTAFRDPSGDLAAERLHLLQNSKPMVSDHPNYPNLSNQAKRLFSDSYSGPAPSFEEAKRMCWTLIGMSEMSKPKRSGHWSTIECDLLLRLHKWGYSARQVAQLFHRTYDSVGRKLRTLIDPSYAPYGQPKQTHRPEISWALRVRCALAQLPNRTGTAAEVRKIIEEKYDDLNYELKPGNKNRRRWHHSVDGAISSSKYIINTGLKRGRAAVWALRADAPLIPSSADDSATTDSLPPSSADDSSPSDSSSSTPPPNGSDSQSESVETSDTNPDAGGEEGESQLGDSNSRQGGDSSGPPCN